MENIVLLVHVLIAFAIIGLILLQQGKGAEMGASFGAGASQTLFGASGSGNFFSRATAWLATAFFVTSFSLAVLAKQSTSIDDDIPVPMEETEIPVLEESSDVPVLNEEESIDVPVIDEASASEVADDVSDVVDETITDEEGDVPQE
ncbi:preprotein translocase subunit SecG [Teredinibacter sp. KSP-S5-2]|uniref:preprotein translocase subunit SecG n=1 Tax=Teredinibacter sp. KSP-S5-2 TaxID=3034506 RepID=UPI00293492B2|nr:preprotein translocase subunit SecG [Teredinibacter sp. KSP-S5-2]WNO08217.1 preprotein translocase subunit SecG [Teredinibacter sp. KSP-S5-2]